MGRGKNKGRGGRRGGGGGGGGGGPRPHKPRDASWKPYSEIVKKNEKLERFYNTLLDLSSEDRQAEFWDALRRELPNSFRFCGSKGHALVVRDILRSRYIPELQKITHSDGQPVEPPRPVPWYPDELAWSMATSKSVVRRFPPFARFQKFLVSETNVGNMSRQEVVSMIPPLFMDLRPGMAVLDMCAAPGSKSAQLVEMLHAGEEARVRKALREYAAEDGLDLGPETEEERNADLTADPADSGRATGLLVANDADYKRAHTLVHQLKRLSSPNIVVVNHDATMFPAIRLPPDEGTGGKPRYLKFDRVLADVPCSGDGTLRKNYNVWRDWVPANGLGLHVTQHRILVKALQALKVGGRVVYSTCSMNPVENEAVVSAAIDRCGGPDKVQIVDCADKIPGLKRLPGMKSWKIMDRSGTIWNSWKEVKERAVPDRDGRYPERVAETMFPYTSGPCADLPLERCMRFYAHLQDTGAFFVAVLEKKGDIKARNEKDARQATAPNANSSSAQPVANGAKRPLEDDPAEEGASKKNKIEGADDDSKSGGQTKELPVKAVAKDGEAATANGHSITSNGDVETGQNGNGADAVAENGHASIDATTERISKGVQDSSAALANSDDADSAEPLVTHANQGYEGKKEGKGYNEEPFKFLPPDHTIIQNIVDFYKLSPRFPRDRWMVRNAAGEPAKAIYYTSALVRDVLTENEGRGVRFIQAGVKMFMRQDAPAPEVCRWRIQSEGMALVQGYVGEARVVHLRNKETLRKLLVEMFPVIKDGGWKNFDEIGERVRDIPMGCAVLRVEPEPAGGGDLAFSERMALPLWKSIHSLNLMLPKEDRAAMLLRVFDDTTPLVNLGLQKDGKKAETGDGEGAEVKGDTEAGAGEAVTGDVAGDGPSEEVDVADMPTPEGMDD